MTRAAACSAVLLPLMIFQVPVASRLQLQPNNVRTGAMPSPMPTPTVTPTATPANTTTPPTATSTTPPPNTTTPAAPMPDDCPSILDLVAASEDLSTLGMAVQVHTSNLQTTLLFPVFPNCIWWRWGCPYRLSTHAAKQLLPPESILLFLVMCTILRVYL